MTAAQIVDLIRVERPTDRSPVGSFGGGEELEAARRSASLVERLRRGGCPGPRCRLRAADVVLARCDGDA